MTFTFRDARSEVVTSVTYEGAVNCADTKVSARACGPPPPPAPRDSLVSSRLSFDVKFSAADVKLSDAECDLVPRLFVALIISF